MPRIAKPSRSFGFIAQRGIATVEMEAAALFAVTEEGSSHAFRTEELLNVLIRIFEVTLQVVGSEGNKVA